MKPDDMQQKRLIEPQQPARKGFAFFENSFEGIALYVLVAMAYLTMFVGASDGGGGRFYSWGEITLLILLGVIYVYLSMNPDIFTGRWPHPQASLLFFLILYGLVLLIGLLGRGEGQIWLLVLPPIAQAAEISLRWLIGVCLAALLVGWGIYIILLNQIIWQVPLFITPAVIFVAAFSQIADRERRSREKIETLAGELREANLKLSEYAAKIEELATMRERNRMAREIHDSLGHYLTVVNVQIGAAQAIMRQDPEKAADAMSKAQRLTQEGLAEVRQSVAMLRESRTARPLTETLPDLIELTRAAGIEARLHVHGEPRPLSSKITQALYRTAQEGLTNVRRHAGAALATVDLDFRTGDVVTLRVADDGRGAADTSGGFGLMGIRERIQLLGGDVRVETEPGGGFALTVDVPIPQAGASGAAEGTQLEKRD